MSAQNLHFTSRYTRCESGRDRHLARKYRAQAVPLLGHSGFWRMCLRVEGR
jgi:hypothetical protein